MSRRRKLGTVYALAGLSLVLGVVVGVAAYGSRATEGMPVVPIGREARDLVLPFDDYWLSTFEIHTVESAEDVLIRDCMREKGLEWPQLPPPDPEAVEPPNRRRYGVIEPDVAAHYGYHLPPPTPSRQERETAWRQRQKLSARVRIAAYGKGGGGCWKEAHDHLLRNTKPFDIPLYNKYVMEAFDASRDDPEVAEGFRQWSTCMAHRGFHYPDPFSSLGDAEWAKTPRPSAKELATATADVQCKKESGMIADWARIDTRIQQELIQDREHDFRRFAETKARWLEAARQVLAENVD